MFQTVALSGSRGERQLFSDVSVTVKPGTLLAVLGANGSGKTSFLRMLCGLLLPDGGAILWQGKDIRQLKELYTAQLTYIGHLNGIKDELTPAEHPRSLPGWLVMKVPAQSCKRRWRPLVSGNRFIVCRRGYYRKDRSAAWRWRVSGFPRVRYGSWMSRSLHSMLRPQVT